MIANLLLIAFLLGMAYIWSIYGFFSSFLQLVIVIAAGSLALAVWEPVTLGLLIERFPDYAWGVGLLGPFALILIVLRLVCDVIVRQNVQFPRVVNFLGGAGCGLLGGILITGLVWVGIGFLPLGPSIAGVQQYDATSGQVRKADAGGLWIEVDRMAMNFFNGLSTGAFSSRRPLAWYQPQIAQQAGAHRLHTDRNASLVARPSGVSVQAAYVQSTPIPGLPTDVAEALGPQATRPGGQLLIVDTQWQQQAGTYDQDRAVRIAPSQVQLVGFTGSERSPHAVFIPPTAYTRITNFQAKTRSFHPFGSGNRDARSNQQSELFGWVFVVPDGVRPQFVLVRHLRFDLPQPNIEPDAFALALGQSPAPQAEDQPPQAAPATTGPARERRFQYIELIELTGSLPQVFNRNAASGLSYEGSAVSGGEATISEVSSSMGARTTIKDVYVPEHQSPIRVKLSAANASGIYGQALAATRSLGAVTLTDQRGQQWAPFAYVWRRGGDNQLVHVDPNQPIRAANQLPLNQMQPGHELYLYFAVPHDTGIVGYQIGDKREDIEPPIIAE